MDSKLRRARKAVHKQKRVVGNVYAEFLVKPQCACHHPTVFKMMDDMFMKLLFLLIAIITISGCTSSATSDRLDALERQLGSAQSTANEALNLAKQAGDNQSSMSSDLADAQRMARQALDTATETAERLSRMEKECCGGK